MSSSAFLRYYDLLPRPGEFPQMWAKRGLGCVLWRLNIGNMNSLGTFPDFVSEEFPLEEQLLWWNAGDRGNLLKSIYFLIWKWKSSLPHFGNYLSKSQGEQFEVSVFRDEYVKQVKGTRKYLSFTLLTYTRKHSLKCASIWVIISKWTWFHHAGWPHRWP